MPLDRVDLNLLRVFDLIYTHRSVAAAGRALGVTPSAVSHALARLRVLVGDELFTAAPDGMRPTRRAAELAPGIGEGLEQLVRALEASPFDPARSPRSFHLASSDYATTLLCPGLIARVLADAPNATVRVLPFGRTDIVARLEEGRVDLVLGWFGPLPTHLRRRALMDEQEALVVRPGHPLAGRRPSRADLLAFPHLVVDLGGDGDGTGDGFREERGAMRRVWIERLLLESRDEAPAVVGRIVATLPEFAAVVPAIAATDAIATLPRRLALQAAARDGVVLLELPYRPLSVPVEAVWHERADADPGLRWLLEQIVAEAAAVA